MPELISLAFNKEMQPYEFIDAAADACDQSAAAAKDAESQVFEKLHQVAFRTGLGNPVFASEEALHGLTRAEIYDYIAKNFTSDRITIVGTGVSHSDLSSLVEEATLNIQLQKSSGETAKSKYFGGEARIEAGPHSQSQLVIAYPGASYSESNYAVSKVLQALLGGCQHVKYGTSAGLLASSSTENISVKAFSTSYKDTGLFGIQIKGDASELKSAASKSIAILKEIASKGVSPSQLSSAQKSAMVCAESETSIIEAATTNISTFGTHICDSLQSVTSDQVSTFAKLMVSAKPSVVAYGNLLVLPYADEL